MLRASCNQFKGQSTANYNNGAVLNSNLQQDIQCRHESESFYGFQTSVPHLLLPPPPLLPSPSSSNTKRADKREYSWVAGHRNGESGLANPNTSDINLYMTAIQWTEQQLGSGAYLTDDTRFWVDV